MKIIQKFQIKGDINIKYYMYLQSYLEIRPLIILKFF